MIVVTGATGKLGQLVIKELLERVPASQIVAAVRSIEKASELASKGVQVREADYSRPETLVSAFSGADKVLLISGNEPGVRVAHHQAVIAACIAANVKLLAYTSILRADTSRLGLAIDHLKTEESIRSSGMKFIFLRNGWYLENNTEALGQALQLRVILGAAKDGRFAAASRADYAAAAAVVLAESGYENKVYELAGDESYSLSELADAVSKIFGTSVTYKDLAQADYQAALVGFGLPVPMAAMLAETDAGAAEGGLDSQVRDLRTLIARPTTTLAAAVIAAVDVR